MPGVKKEHKGPLLDCLLNRAYLSKHFAGQLSAC